MADDGVGVLRFLGEFDHAIGFIGCHDAEFIGAFDRHIHDADGNIRFALLVVRNHRAVVHFINMIARQNQHVRRVMRADEIKILIHRIGGTTIPEGADLLLRGNQFDELAELAAKIAPAALNVLNQ